jgi:hypothetical protein
MQVDLFRILQREAEKQDEQDKSDDGRDEFHQQVPLDNGVRAKCRISAIIFQNSVRRWAVG